MREIMGEALDVVAARPGIDRPADAGLLLQVQLGVARDPGAEVGRQRQRFVERVGVQRLRVTERSSERLDAGARDVVERILSGEAPARGLTMSAQRQALVA